jgi:hypothetical protein
MKPTWRRGDLMPGGALLSSGRFADTTRLGEAAISSRHSAFEPLPGFGPTLPTLVLQHVGSYLGYTGRAGQRSRKGSP